MAPRRLVGPIFVLACVGLVSATAASPRTPTPRPSSTDFTEDYRISDYLATTAQLLARAPDERIALLRAFARNRYRSSQIIPLCRMLFEAKDGDTFRRPALGTPQFVDPRSARNWPLEPITLFEGVPILVVRGYSLAGKREGPEQYLEYCLKACKWREVPYIPPRSEELQAIVERFIAAHPKVAVNADWLRAQAM
jgi:hypothetical protein